jgi:hypothetical protein
MIRQLLTCKGNYTNAYNPSTSRDLGFTGKIGGSVINSFGDTGLCRPGQVCPPISANSAGLGLSPVSYKDTPDSSKPSQFCKYFDYEVSAILSVQYTSANYSYSPRSEFSRKMHGLQTN